MKETKQAILVVSFGTSYEETRKKTIEAIEQDLAAAFLDRRFYRAWTSGIIMKKVKATQGLCIDNPDEAFNRMKEDGMTDILVVPTVLTAGGEYKKTLDAAEAHRSEFEQIRISAPLLSDADDIQTLAVALEEIFGEIDRQNMLALMGHGSEFEPLNVYERLDTCFKQDGYSHFRVGTVEFSPGFEPVMQQMKATDPGKVYLTPLMVVAGDHALNDLAGEEDSWNSLIRSEGYETECILKGMGEYSQIRALYVSHAKDALEG